MTEKERGVKHEEGGFARSSRPSTVWCNRLDCSKPSRAGRVAAFTRAFINANRAWFDDLTAAIRAKLACFPKAALGENGEHFMNSSLATDALAYATIQVMRPSAREDRPHFDGAASLLHAGLTVWGRRGVEIRLQPEAEWQRLEQKPGSFYVGNLCAAWHKVVHLPRKDAGPLLRQKTCTERNGQACAHCRDVAEQCLRRLPISHDAGSGGPRRGLQCGEHCCGPTPRQGGPSASHLFRVRGRLHNVTGMVRGSV